MWRNAASVGGLTLLSRLFGFVRDVLMAAFLGAGPVADAFMVAFRLPNHFRAIFAEGAFNAAFVPRYAAVLTTNGETGAREFSGAILSLIAIVQIALLAVAYLAMPLFVGLLAPGFRDDPQQFALAIDLTRITFPYLGLISVVTLMAGVLNAHNRFAAAAAAPVLLNISMIASLFAASAFPSIAHALAWGVVASGVAQMLYLLWELWRRGHAFALRVPRWTVDMRRFLRAFGPAVLGSAGVQIAMFADTIIASFLPPGSVSYLYYADRLYQLPLAVIGIAVGVVLLPDLSRKVAAGDEPGARTGLNRALEGIIVLTLPCVVVFMLAAEPVMAALFGRGQFDAAAVAGSAAALQAYGVGLTAVVAIRALTPAFHARGDTATPVKALAVSIVINVLLKILLVGTLAHAGLALATACGAWVNAVLLALLLGRRGMFAPDRRMIRLCILALAGGFAMAAVLEALVPHTRPLIAMVPEFGVLFEVSVRLAAGLIAYVAVLAGGWVLMRRDPRIGGAS
ncbi:murein biosynthesis integral membrane protein MurJ [Terrihabitans rhizophilus]|uniref:Probable lipid II flippase MurJ n=1 Tax=Terrihabitans rhizophilus TaxID=3092662 RepID=A0ABU4RQG7_9HYPH|nr:murein biosynthesis integral membrane protein MurJ [Terrihabitans sp. PJ23]MDX6807095.1 murein biosynthesis integral membrane protein MurJ [Terrihabitans sp. PJ23]